MIEKNKILESWIMVEHLSEGDIGLNDKAILTLNDLQEQDFYSLFLHKIEKKKWNRRQKGGVVVYFDISGSCGHTSCRVWLGIDG